MLSIVTVEAKQSVTSVGVATDVGKVNDGGLKSVI